MNASNIAKIFEQQEFNKRLETTRHKPNVQACADRMWTNFIEYLEKQEKHDGSVEMAFFRNSKTKDSLDCTKYSLEAEKVFSDRLAFNFRSYLDFKIQIIDSGKWMQWRLHKPETK